MTRPIRILIADDHAMVRQGVAAFLRTEPDFEIVGEADTGDAAAAIASAEQPDVVILDLMMPQGGVDGVRRVRLASPRSAVVVLTSYDEGQLAVKALKAGALSFLLKDIAAEDLAVAVRRAARRESTLHPRVAAMLADALREDSLDAPFRLTPREHEVLTLIAQGLTNREIALRLAVAEKTVKVHVSNLLAKLGLSDRTKAAALAWRRGWVGPAS